MTNVTRFVKRHQCKDVVTTLTHAPTIVACQKVIGGTANTTLVDKYQVSDIYKIYMKYQTKCSIHGRPTLILVPFLVV